MSSMPRPFVEMLESTPWLPEGAEERFHGYGVMGLPFRSGHVLVVRRFPATSIGPAYSSVWHRDPGGRWTFYSDVPPRQGCPRYFGAAAADSIETAVRVAWSGPDRFTVEVPLASLEWEVRLGATMPTRAMNTAASLLPDRAWRDPRVLSAMAAVAGRVLKAGRIGLQGRVPNGQQFTVNPRVIWAVTDTRAVLAGTDLGPPGPVQPQARLGDFWIPQWGLFAVGQAFFEPFDPARHSTATAGPR